MKPPRHVLTIDDVLADLQPLTNVQTRLVCAAVVERAAPVFRACGRRSSQSTVREALKALWRIDEDLSRYRKVIRALPEARQDDSHALEYHAGVMLHVLYEALGSGTRGKARGAVAHCFGASASLWDSIDVMLTARPGQTFRYDPKSPPVPGRLGAFELRAQIADLRTVATTTLPPPRLPALMRTQAKRASRTFEAAMPRLAARQRLLQRASGNDDD
jgi:hypothetical protein